MLVNDNNNWDGEMAEICDYCNEVDAIPYFFLKCAKIKEFWNMIINWLYLLNIPISNKCIIFGFPGPTPETREKIHVINFCIFYIKSYISIQR